MFQKKDQIKKKMKKMKCQKKVEIALFMIE